MELKDFIAQKLEQLQNIEREKEILVAGLNKYLNDITERNITVGHITTFEGVQYEVIDFKPPKIWGYNDLNELRYEVLCLRLVNGNKDNSDLAKRIRKDKEWREWRYDNKKQEKLKAYYKKNVLQLTNAFYVKFK